jgi:hypothetical protein
MVLGKWIVLCGRIKMKNFINRIECVVEPDLLCYKRDSGIQIKMRCIIGDTEVSINRFEDTDFLVSHFDLVFDHMRENIRYKFLEEVKSNG